MFFMILLGIALIAVGVTSILGGAWGTVATVILIALGLKVLFMGTAFGFFRRRARAMGRHGWGPDGEGGRGPCGKHFRARAEEWHRQAHAPETGATAGDPLTAE